MKTSRTKKWLRMCLLLSKHLPGLQRKHIMNLEQRNRYFNLIRNLEGLLAYAVRTGDKAEESRIRAELAALVEEAE